MIDRYYTHIPYIYYIIHIYLVYTYIRPVISNTFDICSLHLRCLCGCRPRAAGRLAGADFLWGFHGMEMAIQWWYHGDVFGICMYICHIYIHNNITYI